ncbi:MAG TPA: photosystem P840 reaction-center cytochrome c-551 [Candidatus Acidoferrales bacterium]|jgi:ferredoxin-NADP reductase|nr:photosystem P840 reaction-center cytochrome c-551 [Candidatus Acidoferrales bacterium]
MLNSSASLWLGVTFVLIGAINVWLILQASARVRDAKASTRLIAAHRIGGYLFIALFCVMGYFMVARLGDVGGGAPPSTMIHLTLAMVLSPLLFVKVLVARYYKSYYGFLTPIGLMIFVLSFVLIGITAGPSLAHRARMQTVSLAAIDLPPAAIDIDMAASTMEKRCSKCHNLDRIAGAHKDARGWLATVNRMKALPHSGISDEDARIIFSYLASQMGPKGPAAAASLEVARAVVDQRCGRCHSLDRVYKTAETPEEWRATVDRMVAFAEGSGNAFQPGEDEQIVTYLSATQTPDAVNRRQARAAAASSSGRSMVTKQAAAAPDQPAPPSRYDARRYDVRTIGFIAVVFSSMLVLVVRRPSRAPFASAGSDTPAATVPARVSAVVAATSSSGGSLILKLASITQQASDAKTLRFIVPDGRKLNARPGQFLVFSFLFDGKKVIRSYSICSSAARSGYIEITTKRVGQGCVSVFLNDRAPVGMTVEANGPFGHFCLDESQHRNIVLLAAGSGITPMMAMLRYMDDLCLETTATLLYCVRTNCDIIFESELEQLRSRLTNFQYHVLLSQPHAEWSGPRGHVSREFIENTVKDIALRDFFLCGPPGFMDASRTILIGLGVKPERMMQESFGSSASKSVQPFLAAETGVVVEFARSGRTHAVRSGQTLLEAAEEHGVGIPSSCRQGQCGTCKTRLLEGNVRMDAEEGLDSDSRAQGYVLTCVGHAEGRVKLDA